MAAGPLQMVLRRIRRLVGRDAAAAEPDRQLLERFSQQQDGTAFAALVERHGSMVLGVCRRVIGDVHAAEDAFQAVFLILMRKAGDLDERGALASWLYTVAHRVALRARANQARQRKREREAMVRVADEPAAEAALRDLRPVLDEELARLPERYRLPVVMCYLEGRTELQAAQELGWPQGTVSSRLLRARELLRKRLSHRGLAFSAALAGAVAAESVAAAALQAATVKAVLLVAAGQALPAQVFSSQTVALTEGVLKTMLRSKLKYVAAVWLIGGMLGAGLGLLAYAALADKPQAGGDFPEKMTVAPFPKNQWINKCALSPDGARLAGALANAENGIHVWESRTGRLLHKVEIHRGNDFIDALAYSPDGLTFAAVSHPARGQAQAIIGVGVVRPDGQAPDVAPPPPPPPPPPNPAAIAVWNAATGKEIVRIAGQGDSFLCYSPDSQTLAASSPDGTIRLWNAATGKETLKLAARDKEHDGAQLGFQSIAFSPDGKLVAAALYTDFVRVGGLPREGGPPERRSFGTLVLWEAASGKEVARVQQVAAETLKFSPDGKTLAFYGMIERDNRRATPSIYLWDVAMRKETRRLEGAWARQLAFSPDGKTLVSADSTILRVWDVAAGQLLRQFQAHIDEGDHGLAMARSQVQAIHFLPGGKFLTAGANGTIHRWDLNALPANVPDDRLRHVGSGPSTVSPAPQLPPNP